MLAQYLKWCFLLKEILPWQVALLSDAPLTKEQFDYPASKEAVEQMRALDFLKDGGKTPDIVIFDDIHDAGK